MAVHPEDKRYKHVHGRYVVHPFTSRRIPIVVDDFVEREFGTGRKIENKPNLVLRALVLKVYGGRF